MYNLNMKKSEQTKDKLIKAVIILINEDKKISMASVSKEAKTACGSFFPLISLNYNKTYKC